MIKKPRSNEITEWIVILQLTRVQSHMNIFVWFKKGSNEITECMWTHICKVDPGFWVTHHSERDSFFWGECVGVISTELHFRPEKRSLCLSLCAPALECWVPEFPPIAWRLANTKLSDVIAESADDITPTRTHPLNTAQRLPSVLVVARAMPLTQLLHGGGYILCHHPSMWHKKIKAVSKRWVNVNTN